MSLMDRAQWFERILCRSKEQQLDEIVNENPVLCWDLSTQRKPARSKYSRYPRSSFEVQEKEEHLQILVPPLSPNRDEERRPSMWGYASIEASVTDSSSVSEQ